MKLNIVKDMINKIFNLKIVLIIFKSIINKIIYLKMYFKI